MTPRCHLTRRFNIHKKLSGWTVADLGGVRGVHLHPPLAASNVFCVHNCTSPSNDYAAVACSNNNEAQLHTHVSVPYWSPDVWLGLELLWDIQFSPEGSATACFGVQDFEIHWISCGFRISEWVCGFRSGFLDFSLDFCRQVSSCMFLVILVIVPSLAKNFS